MTAAPWRVSRAATQPMRSMFVSRSSFENPRPLERCVRTVSPSRYSTIEPALFDRGADEVRDGRLARTGQSREPERETAVAPALRLRMLVRVDVVSHSTPSPVVYCHGCRTRACPSPDHRPARSSSPDEDGARAGHAADRRIARVVQRVVRNLVHVDVRLDAFCVPVHDRVDLPDAVALRPLDALLHRPASAPARGGCR